MKSGIRVHAILFSSEINVIKYQSWRQEKVCSAVPSLKPCKQRGSFSLTLKFRIAFKAP